MEHSSVGTGKSSEEALGEIEVSVTARGTLVGNGSLDRDSVGGDGDGSTTVGSGVSTTVLRSVEGYNVVARHAGYQYAQLRAV